MTNSLQKRKCILQEEITEIRHHVLILYVSDKREILEGNQTRAGSLRLHDGKYIKPKLLCPSRRLCIKRENQREPGFSRCFPAFPDPKGHLGGNQRESTPILNNGYIFAFAFAHSSYPQVWINSTLGASTT